MKRAVAFFLLLCGTLILLGASCRKQWVPGPPAGATPGVVDGTFAEQILAEHNFVRTKPKEYAEQVLKPYIQKNGSTSYTQSLLETLTTMAPAPAMRIDNPLMVSAQKFAEDHVNMPGKIGHTGSNGSNMTQRIQAEAGTNRYSTWAESCSYGIGKKAREVMLQLLIDEGVSSLGHRKNALNPKLNCLGVGFSDAKGVAYGSVTVIDYGAI